MRDYMRFCGSVYLPQLICMVFEVPVGVAGLGNLRPEYIQRDRYDALIMLVLPWLFMYLSMALVRRSKSLLACILSIYPFAVVLYVVALYPMSAAFGGMAEGFMRDVSPFDRWIEEWEGAGVLSILPLGLVGHLLVIVSTIRASETILKYRKSGSNEPWPPPWGPT